MATAPTLTLCDDLVTQLLAATTAANAAPNVCRRAYWSDPADAENERSEWTTGRRVTIAPSLPTAYGYEPATRGEDLYMHHVSVLVEKRYPETEPGDPTRAWIDDEVNWVYTYVVLGFDWDFRSGAVPTFNRDLVTVSSEVQLFNIQDLLSRGKLFSSQVDLVFHELVDV